MDEMRHGNNEEHFLHIHIFKLKCLAHICHICSMFELRVEGLLLLGLELSLHERERKCLQFVQ